MATNPMPPSVSMSRRNEGLNGSVSKIRNPFWSPTKKQVWFWLKDRWYIGGVATRFGLWVAAAAEEVLGWSGSKSHPGRVAMRGLGLKRVEC